MTRRWGRAARAVWRLGPDLNERRWGTVREEYSPNTHLIEENARRRVEQSEFELTESEVETEW